MRIFISLGILLLSVCSTSAQTITMSNNCTRWVQKLESYNQIQLYDSVVVEYPAFEKKCTAKDAKYKGGTLLAHAYNGLSRHAEALDAANRAIKANKTYISAISERAIAYAGLGRMEESKSDYRKIADLAKKNQDQSARSTIYAMLANISFVQGQTDSAFYYIDQAMTLDARTDYSIQKGDMYYKLGDVDKAFMAYDQAVAAGRTDPAMYTIRASQRLKVYQKKYGTDNITKLAAQMTGEEKRLCCIEFDKLKALGQKNMTLDMAHAFLCEE